MSPTDQFQIGNVYGMLVAVFVVLSGFVVVLWSKESVALPSSSVSLYFGFIVSMHNRMMVLLAVLFGVIAFMNLVGLNGGVFAAYSQISLTLALAGIPFVASVLMLAIRYGMYAFAMFLPAGVPLWISPLLVAVEIISFMFRLVSLSVRLFANLTAGHCLLFLFSSVCWSVPGLVVVPLLMAFMLLEAGVAVLQAYIFTTLSSLYLTV